VLESESAGTTLASAIVAPEQVRTLLGRPTPCVGRERELAKLAEHLDECREEGVARVVLVTGPPGIGKSRLRTEFWRVAGLRGGVEPWLSWCDAMRAASPLALLASLVSGVAGLRDGMSTDARHAQLSSYLAGRLTGDALVLAGYFLGELCGAPAPRDVADDRLRAARREPALMDEQIRRAWLGLLEAECARGPLLIILEDIQWADTPSLRFVDHALRDLAERRARLANRASHPRGVSARDVPRRRAGAARALPRVNASVVHDDRARLRRVRFRHRRQRTGLS
jgi:eukaryotic-like serine/threonine-protein kinase